MPVKKKAHGSWTGTPSAGTGTMNTDEGEREGKFNTGTRFADGRGINPEEVLGAAHAGCFSITLSGLLDSDGHKPAEVDTTADVKLEKSEAGYYIDAIELTTRVKADAINQEKLDELAEQAKKKCMVSKALDALDISVKAEVIR
ncbi:OsmC family peroxiredoxin [candidate division GN15 bacterium]|nr:OsmC family peroxiredoxin [candidate division GN15 bacterium]